MTGPPWPRSSPPPGRQPETGSSCAWGRSWGTPSGHRAHGGRAGEGPGAGLHHRSIHTLSEGQGGRDLYFLSPKDEGETRACLADYLGQVRKLAEWGRFQVLGHLTLPLRYLNEGRGLHASFDGFEAEMEDIFRTIIPKGNRHRAEHQPGQHPPAGREVAADVPGAGGRDRHPGHRCPQPRRGGLCRPGGAGPSARVRFHTLLHLPAGHAGVARIVICNFGNIWL